MKLLTIIVCFYILTGCAVVAVADLAVTTVATVARAGVSTLGAAVDNVTQDKKNNKVKQK
ncbi:MAG: hypothetical protein FJY62_09635 [Betaproteobacteria bacterium]|nr:hypothetical protein [Betaproteobacteria bacterium]